ncbi:hypothetical protein [Acetobacter aceti]|uniref:hypothetical protein n=1 Tax=Acetobacter aceti TaxID=435 RepID=UPI000C089E67|nr:hypothetical protein [Acetobacter aceti]
MTDHSDELAAKRAAIRKARNSTKPAVPAEQVLAILRADLARAQVENAEIWRTNTQNLCN